MEGRVVHLYVFNSELTAQVMLEEFLCPAFNDTLGRLKASRIIGVGDALRPATGLFCSSAWAMRF